MAISASPVQTSTSGWFAAATSRARTSFTSNFQVGNKIFMVVSFGADPGAMNTPTDTSSGGPNTWVQIGSTVSSGSTTFQAAFYCDVSHQIATTDSITPSWTNSVVHQVSISEWSGAASGAVASSVTNSATSTTGTTSALSAATSGDLVIGFFSGGSANAWTASTDGQGNTMSSLHASQTGQGKSSFSEYLVETGTSAYNPAATCTSQAWVARGIRVNAAASAPVYSVNPVLTGTARRGQVLSSTTGTASNSPSYTYQWKRDGSNIASATSSTYTLVAADVGHIIKCTVTATNGSGSASADSNSTLAVSQARTAVMGDARIEFCANDMTVTRNVGSTPAVTYPLVPDGSPFLLLNP